MRSFLYTTLITALASIVSAYPNGAPVCGSDPAVIGGVANAPMGQPGDQGVTFSYNFKNGQYEPGKSYKITVSAKQKWKGILLYALDGQKDHPGQFTLPTGFKYVTPQTGSCPGDPKGTITHSDANPKGPSVDFTWTAPAKDAGPISFAGTVVTGKAAGFQVFKDTKLFNAVGGTTANGSNSTSTTNTSTTASAASSKDTDTSTTSSSKSSSTGGAKDGKSSATSSSDSSSASTTDDSNPKSSYGTSDSNSLLPQWLMIVQLFIATIGAKFIFSNY